MTRLHFLRTNEARKNYRKKKDWDGKIIRNKIDGWLWGETWATFFLGAYIYIEACSDFLMLTKWVREYVAWFGCRKMIKRINLHRHLSVNNLRMFLLQDFLFWLKFVYKLATQLQQLMECLHKQLKCDCGVAKLWLHYIVSDWPWPYTYGEMQRLKHLH